MELRNKLGIFYIIIGKLTNDGSTTPAGLIAAALAHAFALFVAVSVGANISGGHVNPAVTFGAFIGGHITLLRSILYWIAQCLGSVVACLLLKFATGGQVRSFIQLNKTIPIKIKIKIPIFHVNTYIIM